MGNIISFFSLSCYGVLSHCWDSIITGRATYVGIDGALSNPPSPSWHGRFTDDQIAEILSRLPVKSLVRFRCVCKSWLAIISGPNFATKNTSRTIKFLETVNPTRSIDFEAIFKDEDRLEYTVPLGTPIWILGSCNGLICREEEDGGDLILWNPSTRDTYKLPEIKTRTTRFSGFGYDSTNEDYKVIVGLETEIAVFTSKTGLWKIIEQNVGRFVRGEGCFVSGALHWLEDLRSSFKIISFDLAEEKFQELPPPNICTKEFEVPNRQLRIGKTIDNYLFLYRYNPESHRSQTGIAITIWVMYEYGVNECWTRVVQIPSSSLSNYYIFSYKPISVLEDGEVLMNRISKRSQWEQLVLYDPKENRQKKYRRLVHDYCTLPQLYVETSVSPKPDR